MNARREKKSVPYKRPRMPPQYLARSAHTCTDLITEVIGKRWNVDGDFYWGKHPDKLSYPHYQYLVRSNESNEYWISEDKLENCLPLIKTYNKDLRARLCLEIEELFEGEPYNITRFKRTADKMPDLPRSLTISGHKRIEE